MPRVSCVHVRRQPLSIAGLLPIQASQLNYCSLHVCMLSPTEKTQHINAGPALSQHMDNLLCLQ